MDANMKNAIAGCILGTAVGDAIGLPAEGIPKRRGNLLYPNLDHHHFFFNHGMISDDTEHTCMAAQALIASAGDVHQFASSFARQLRIWILLLPSGVGFATLRSCLKLQVGIPPDKSGVFSAGNGPAMRSASIGVCYGHDPARMRELVRASTRITHTDQKAEYGALAVALAAHLSADLQVTPCTPGGYLDSLTSLLDGEGSELAELVTKAVESIEAGQSTEAFAGSLGYGDGVSGYIYSTVPIVLHAWFRYPLDYKSAIIEIIKCGGDADTTAAILGGIIGASVGKSGIPHEWLSGLMEWPRSVRWMETVSARLAEVVSNGRPDKSVPLSVPALFVRNVFFLIVILLHGFRRLFPPY
ncbi:MAG: ADP-ribosylglycohydrolase family protein [Armatimonadota bacterium]